MILERLGGTRLPNVARSFMDAFPDRSVMKRDLLLWGQAVEYHWTLIVTNSGGLECELAGFETWRFGQGRAEDRRQLQQGMQPESS